MTLRKLNFQHLYYFWITARESSLSRAAERLHLTPQTVCAQIHNLERRLGVKLFQRQGRRLVLTDTGRLVLEYAEEIFSLGEALVERLQGEAFNRFRVGIINALPKWVTFQLLRAILTLSDNPLLVCREGDMKTLLIDLAAHRLELILSDHPPNSALPVRAYSHLLGSCGVTFMAKTPLAQRYRTGFPKSLHGAPLLTVSHEAAIRKELDAWLSRLGIVPQVVAEFDDSSLLKVFGQAGFGIFCIPTLVEEDVRRQYHVEIVGRTKEIEVKFYAISLERRLGHPITTAVFESLRKTFSNPPPTVEAPGRGG